MKTNISCSPYLGECEILCEDMKTLNNEFWGKGLFAEKEEDRWKILDKDKISELRTKIENNECSEYEQIKERVFKNWNADTILKGLQSPDSSPVFSEKSARLKNKKNKKKHKSIGNKSNKNKSKKNKIKTRKYKKKRK
tara:strand:- start:569 stop:982 length:414 start_codon:yes stop_codon:yes gene_type:complete